jgi:S-methylmethionine-dependent homocysteine/selenocysteine methylase
VSYRAHLPQLEDRLFLTDGGIETVLIFHEGLELPAFAAFDLLKDEAGTEALRRYYEPYAALARDRGLGFVLESPTWRANPDWGAAIGYSLDDLGTLNRKAIALMEELRDRHADVRPIVISGCIGPQSDGYSPETKLTAPVAQRYHAFQAATFADTAADMVTAITMTYAEEAIGVAFAAAEATIPAAISFTVETDGRLPSGQPLGEAIEQVDGETGSAPAYYMVNCAHPSHLAGALEPAEPWMTRIHGLRPNASTKSHAELNESETLDEGDPVELGSGVAALHALLPRVNVLGGCCGTDARHVAAICAAWSP